MKQSFIDMKTNLIKFIMFLIKKKKVLISSLLFHMYNKIVYFVNPFFNKCLISNKISNFKYRLNNFHEIHGAATS